MDVSGRNGLSGAGRGKGKVVYEGRYAVVVDEGHFALLAYPREDPKGREKEYLLRMAEELLEASDKAFGNTNYKDIYIRADVRYGNGRFALVVRRDDDVWVESFVDDYMDFIMNADLIEVEVVGRNTKNLNVVYQGRYIIVTEGKGVLLHVYGRKDVKMEPGLFAEAVIKEVAAKIDWLRDKLDVVAAMVHIRVWRNNVIFYPVMLAKSEVDFILADNDYAHFVRMADEVKFVSLSRIGHDGGVERKRRTAERVEKRVVERVEEGVVYEGRHVVVVKERRSGLVAYPREVPKGKEKEYLLYMADETSAVLNEIYKRTGNSMVRLSAAVVYDDEAYELAVEKDIGVWTEPAIRDYERFIKTADRVAMKFAGRDIGLFYDAYFGRRIVVIENERGRLYAFARSDVRENREMDPVSLILAVIREVMDEKDELEKKWGHRHVIVRGYVWRNTVPFVPVVYDRNAVDLEPLYGDYTIFVRMADEVRLFPRR